MAKIGFKEANYMYVTSSKYVTTEGVILEGSKRVRYMQKEVVNEYVIIGLSL